MLASPLDLKNTTLVDVVQVLIASHQVQEDGLREDTTLKSLADHLVRRKDIQEDVALLHQAFHQVWKLDHRHQGVVLDMLGGHLVQFQDIASHIVLPAQDDLTDETLERRQHPRIRYSSFMMSFSLTILSFTLWSDILSA